MQPLEGDDVTDDFHQLTAAYRTRQKRFRIAVSIMGLGAALLALGLVLPTYLTSAAPVALAPAGDAVIPPAPHIGGLLTVYARGSEIIQPPDAFGCRLTDGSGASRALGHPAARLAQVRDRMIIADTAEVPLFALTSGDEGSRLSCNGPALASAMPMFVVAHGGRSDMAPMAALSLASLMLVLGFVGTVTYRVDSERGIPTL